MEYCIYMVTMPITYVRISEKESKDERREKEIRERKSNGIMEGFWKCH